MMKTKTETKTNGRKRMSRRNDDLQGVRDFALSIGIGQMSRVRSGWVRQDVHAELGRQDLCEEQSQPQFVIRDGGNGGLWGVGDFFFLMRDFHFYFKTKVVEG